MKPKLADFAAAVGVSTATASRLRRRGVVVGDTLAEQVLSYTDHLRRMAAQHEVVTDGLSLTEERAKLAAAQRLRIEREELVARGELVAVDTVSAYFAEMMAALVNGLTAWPGRLRPALASCETDTEIGVVLGQAVHDIREDLDAVLGRASAAFRESRK
jgi:hypothetical protein